MIKCKNNHVKFRGTAATLLSDLTLIAKALNEAFMERGLSEAVSRKLLSSAIDVAFVPEDKFEEFAPSFAKALVNDLLELEIADEEAGEND